MREPEVGKVYCLIRQVEQADRNMIVCRRVRVLKTDEEQVVLDQGDGTQIVLSLEEFLERSKNDGE
ncbi:MAG: hypothetical protein ACLRPV_01385 [Lacrimispora saccharolytica]